MKSRVRDGTGRLKERGDGERRGTGRLKERGGGERHAPAKPRLVAVLRSKLRFTRFLQVPTGSHCLSPPPSPSGCWITYFPFLSTFPKYRRVHFIFLRPPSPSGYWFPNSCFPGSWLLYSTFLFTCLSSGGLTLSFSAPFLQDIGLPTLAFSTFFYTLS